MKKKSRKILLIILIIFLCMIIPGFYNGMRITEYNLKAEELNGQVRIALVTDLHSCSYGEGQRTLLDTIDEQKPDLVLLGGDLFDQNLPDDNTVTFLRGVSEKYPCYFATGNHEYFKGKSTFTDRMNLLEECGIKRLSGEIITMEVHGTKLNICGLDDPYEWAEGEQLSESDYDAFRKQLVQVASLVEEDTYTILLTHRPEMFDLYSDYDFDLVLAGHAHGGQWRIPGILNGLFAPNQGLFPSYAGGQYDQNDTTMIVSRGLALESTWIPRFYNQPELVIITLEGANP